jgi:hypothetical protein
MPKETASTAEPIVLRKSGDLVLEVDGREEVIAHYDRKTSDLEYATLAMSKAHQRGCAFAIGTINKGKTVSGLQIKTFGVKGVPRDDVSKAPKMPKKDPLLGDQTDALVKWYFAWCPKEAYIRYGVYLNADGEPVRRNVRRRWVEFIDDRADGLYGLEDLNDGKGQQIGKGKFEKAAVAERKSYESLDNQIIARRATCMTFHPNEVVGGFDSSDDSDEQVAVEEEQEA